MRRPRGPVPEPGKATATKRSHLWRLKGQVRAERFTHGPTHLADCSYDSAVETLLQFSRTAGSMGPDPPGELASTILSSCWTRGFGGADPARGVRQPALG